MMKQHTATFQGVLRKLETWQNPMVESCERRAKRYPVRCEGRLISESADLSGDPTEQIVQIRDVSRSGAGLLCCCPIEIGTRWRLKPLANGLTLGSMPIFCRYCRKVVDGVYLIGVEFGIEAATMIAMGVSPSEIAHNETAGSSELLADCHFVDPSELLGEDAA